MSGILMMSVGNSYGSLPVNTVAPVVSGTATVGQTLSTTNGTWLGAPAPTFTYQWQRAGSNIGGATSSTYVLVAADAGSTIRCVVTGTNAVGFASANSNSTASVIQAPANTVAPVVSGTASVGQTLTTTNGTWTGTPTPTFTYQWQRGVSNISGATSSTYMAQFADVGNTLRCVVTGTNTAGSASANSNSTGAVADLAIGAAYQGGFFTGKIIVSGTTYAMVVAPKSSGDSGTLKYKTSRTFAPSAAITLNNGAAASSSMNSADYPAAQFCEGLTIGGYTDWYLPARDELELCWRNLKSYVINNGTGIRDKSLYTYPEGDDTIGNSIGVNLNSSPTGAAYTSTNPARTSVTAFQTGGAEVFNISLYWSSSEFSETHAWGQSFGDGNQQRENKDSNYRARAFRRVAI